MQQPRESHVTLWNPTPRINAHGCHRTGTQRKWGTASLCALASCPCAQQGLTHLAPGLAAPARQGHVLQLIVSMPCNNIRLTCVVEPCRSACISMRKRLCTSWPLCTRLDQSRLCVDSRQAAAAQRTLRTGGITVIRQRERMMKDAPVPRGCRTPGRTSTGRRRPAPCRTVAVHGLWHGPPAHSAPAASGGSGAAPGSTQTLAATPVPCHKP